MGYKWLLWYQIIHGYGTNNVVPMYQIILHVSNKISSSMQQDLHKKFIIYFCGVIYYQSLQLNNILSWLTG